MENEQTQRPIKFGTRIYRNLTIVVICLGLLCVSYLSFFVKPKPAKENAMNADYAVVMYHADNPVSENIAIFNKKSTYINLDYCRVFAKLFNDAYPAAGSFSCAVVDESGNQLRIREMVAESNSLPVIFVIHEE